MEATITSGAAREGAVARCPGRVLAIALMAFCSACYAAKTCDATASFEGATAHGSLLMGDDEFARIDHATHDADARLRSGALLDACDRLCTQRVSQIPAEPDPNARVTGYSRCIEQCPAGARASFSCGRRPHFGLGPPGDSRGL